MGSEVLKVDLEEDLVVYGEPEQVAVFKKLSPEKLEAIVLEHRDHGKRLAWSFLNHWRVRMKHDDVISVVGAALCEAANRFDETKGVAFKTFFFYHLRGMLLKEIARVIHEQKVLQFMPHTLIADSQFADSAQSSSWVLPLVESNNPERIIERRESARMCWDACAQLDPLERDVLIRHYVYDEPLVDIAEQLNYCRCHISRVKSRALSKLEKFIRARRPDQILEQPAKVAPLAVEVTRTNKSRRNSYTGGRGRRRPAITTAIPVQRLRNRA